MRKTGFSLEELQAQYPNKFVKEEKAFSRIRRGSRVFIATGCGQPQYLVRKMVDFVRNHPGAIYDAEVLHVWTLGMAPYTDPGFKANFRHNSFFVANQTRGAVNSGFADYTPIFLYQVPGLIQSGQVPIDVALIQTTLPDSHGYMNLGVSVDIVRAAVDRADLVIAQVNSHAPRVHGDGFVHIDHVDYIIAHDEELLQYDIRKSKEQDLVLEKVGKYVARLIRDGDTIQVGYGSTPGAMIRHLDDKKNLGIHTELLTDGLVELMRKGVVDNSQKTVNRGRTVAAFCMGTKETYDYINDNSVIEFRTIDYTNNPLLIARQKNMVAINSAIELDLTGQGTAESMGRMFYSGIGGQADFMRGAVLAPGGKSILAMTSTSEDGRVSRIVPLLEEGSGITYNRGDLHYVVTEFGIAYLHGKNIRERAMELIAIAHPSFRPWLMEEARRKNLIYRDQLFLSSEQSIYPEEWETHRETRTGLQIFIRPVKPTDEDALKDFFYSLSDQSMHSRFMSLRMDMPHERLQEYTVIDYKSRFILVALVGQGELQKIVGMAEYQVNESRHTADVAFAVRDDHQSRGIGKELLSYLTIIAKKKGLSGFTAEVLLQNRPMMKLFERMGFQMEKRAGDGMFELDMKFEN